MNNNVVVQFIPEEEKLASLERRLEKQRKAKRVINWESIGQKCLGFLLIALAIISYRLTKIDGEFFLLVIACSFFAITAIFGSGSIFYREEV